MYSMYADLAIIDQTTRKFISKPKIVQFSRFSRSKVTIYVAILEINGQFIFFCNGVVFQKL